MFDLNTLLILTIFNVIAFAQVASTIHIPIKFESALTEGSAVLCLAVSLLSLALAALIPTPEVGLATVTIAALVNLLALLGPISRLLDDSRPAEAVRSLRGLARLSIVGAPYAPAAPSVPASAPDTSGKAKPATIRSIRPAAQAAAPRASSGALSRLPGPAQPATPSTASQRASQVDRRVTPLSRMPASALPLTPRQTYRVPQRPNRLPTSSLAFLLSVRPEQMPDIFADAHVSMQSLPALAHRVRLVSTDPRRPVITPQSSNVWPSSNFSEPDPAWQTSYGRIPALAWSA
jgi:hypothetical protein